MRIESNPLAITGFVLAAFAAGCAADAPTAVDGAAADASLSMGAAHCENVRGTGLGNVFGNVTFTGVDPADLLHGATGAAWQPPEIVFRGPAIHLGTYHQIETGELVIRTADRGIAAPVDPPLYRLNIRYEIQPSESEPAGVTGWIQVHGDLVLDLTAPPGAPVFGELPNGHWETRYHGRVCVP